MLMMLFWVIHVLANIPIGYYTTATGNGATLKTQLYNIINNHTVRSYTQLWTDFETTDAQSNGKVWDMYSNCTFTFGTDQDGGQTANTECVKYNREHAFPNSWFGGEVSPMYTDLFHLYPTDKYVNAERSNYPYGVTATPSITFANGSKKGTSTYAGYTGTVFEPTDEYKGDFARTYFYMATRYENVIATWYTNSTEGNAVLQNNSFPVYETWFLNMLGEWHTADPVSAKETARNNAVYGIQGNRNPFIDHPEFVYNIWGVGQAAPSGPADHVTNFSARNIRLQWTDAVGAVTPDGYLVRMSSTGFADIAAPTDGQSYAESSTDKHVPYGTQQVWYKNLSAGTYYFKIFPYKGTGTSIDYKTDGAPQTTKTIQ